MDFPDVTPTLIHPVATLVLELLWVSIHGVLVPQFNSGHVSSCLTVPVNGSCSMTDWEGSSMEQAGNDCREMFSHQFGVSIPPPYFDRPSVQISSTVRTLLGWDNCAKDQKFKARFVCPQSVLDEALCDVIGLARKETASHIVERLDAIAIEPRCKFEVLRNAVIVLGEDWCCDAVDFVTLSVAVGRLQFALRKIGRDCARPASVGSPLLQILLPQKEEHVFAACYLEELARLDGWTVEICDSDHAKRVAAPAAAGMPHAVCLLWSHDAMKPSVDAVVRGLSTIVSKKETFFFSGGHGAMNNSAWLNAHGITSVFDCFDTALRVAGQIVQRTDCNLPFAPPTKTRSGLSSLNK